MGRAAPIEDHERLAQLVRKTLSGAGLEVDTFCRLDATWLALCDGAYAAAVIDRGLPDGDGLNLLRQLRADRF
ncbi:MAG: response regulator [Ferruginibacter sp.]|nr:response regulator [Rhodoferax sp.]